MRRLTDTHCHLNLNSFQDDLPDVLERARAAGVYRILVPGIDLPTSRAAVELASQHAQIYAAVGIHPAHAETWAADSLVALREIATHPKVVAIGEIGLDYYHEGAPHAFQQDILRKQLDLAADVGLPVILHNRQSFEDLWNLLMVWRTDQKKVNSQHADHPGVFHSFEGSLEEANQVAQDGFFVGIGGPLTFKNAAERQQIAKALPMERILIETDSPFLSPLPHRGKRNEPANTTYIGQKLAELRGMDFELVTGATADNAAQLFMWEP